MRNLIGFLVGGACGAGIGLGIMGYPLFFLLTIPAILFLGWCLRVYKAKIGVTVLTLPPSDVTEHRATLHGKVIDGGE